MSAYDVYAFTIKIKSEKPRAWALKSRSCRPSLPLSQAPFTDIPS